MTLEKLLDNIALERSSTAANCQMNRERVCTGGNSYAKDLSFNPLDFIRARLQSGQSVVWVDLCCGSGRALIEATRKLASDSFIDNLEIIGIDLVSMFDQYSPNLRVLRLKQSSVSTWSPNCKVDLITCVHGLHYIGDKLDLIRRACSWLKDD